MANPNSDSLHAAPYKIKCANPRCPLCFCLTNDSDSDSDRISSPRSMDRFVYFESFESAGNSDSSETSDIESSESGDSMSGEYSPVDSEATTVDSESWGYEESQSEEDLDSSDAESHRDEGEEGNSEERVGNAPAESPSLPLIEELLPSAAASPQQSSPSFSPDSPDAPYKRRLTQDFGIQLTRPDISSPPFSITTSETEVNAQQFWANLELAAGNKEYEDPFHKKQVTWSLSDVARASGLDWNQSTRKLLSLCCRRVRAGEALTAQEKLGLFASLQQASIN